MRAFSRDTRADLKAELRDYAAATVIGELEAAVAAYYRKIESMKADDHQTRRLCGHLKALRKRCQAVTRELDTLERDRTLLEDLRLSGGFNREARAALRARRHPTPVG